MGFSAEANCGTALSGVQFAIPAANISVLASMLPLARFVLISSSLTGPTWCPPIAMYHWPAITMLQSEMTETFGCRLQAADCSPIGRQAGPARSL